MAAMAANFRVAQLPESSDGSLDSRVQRLGIKILITNSNAVEKILQRGQCIAILYIFQIQDAQFIGRNSLDCVRDDPSDTLPTVEEDDQAVNVENSDSDNDRVVICDKPEGEDCVIITPDKVTKK